MTDASVARIGRALAETLRSFARERREDDRKQIAALHAELCAEYRAEIEESAHDAEPAQEPAP